MSIQWEIPHQSRYISTASVFTAAFNVPVLGAYGFDVAANENVLVLELQPNTQYLIERVTIGADVSELDYSGALDLSAADRMPRLSLVRRADRVSVYETAIPVPGYVRQQESAVWVRSDNEGDALLATFRGRLNQTAALVGVPQIRVTVSFGVYGVESTIYNRKFLSAQTVRGGA